MFVLMVLIVFGVILHLQGEDMASHEIISASFGALMYSMKTERRNGTK